MDPDPPSDDVSNPCENNPAKNPELNTSGENSASSGADVPQARDEIQKIFEEFAGSIGNLLQGSVKTFFMDINASFQSVEKKINDFTKLHYEVRLKLYEFYSDQFATLLQKFIVNTEQIKKQGEKLASIFQEQKKLFLQFQVLQRQNMEDIHELCEKYLKSLKDLDHIQGNVVSGEIRNFLASLGENPVMETEKEAAVQESPVPDKIPSDDELQEP